MPAVEDLLAGLADAPPAAPRPVGEIRARARRRVRRRRGAVAAVALVVALGTGVAVGLSLDGDLGEDVAVIAGPTPTPATTPPATPSGSPDPAPPTDPTDPTPEPGSLPRAVIAGPTEQVRDGARLLITLTEVATGDVVTVAQCDGDDIDRCSAARTRTITVQHGPETQLTFVVFHDVAWPDGEGDAAGWAPCDPCALVIRADGHREPVAVQPMTMRPTPDPIRPALEVVPPGPHRPGVTVQARVTGLQPLVAVSVRPCVVDGATCRAAGDPTEVIADDAGAATVAGLVVPAVVGGRDCSASTRPCGVGLDPVGPGPDALAFVALDLGG